MSPAEKPRVFIARPIFPEVIERLAEHAEVVCSKEDRCLEHSELERCVRGKGGLFAFLTDRVDAELMDAAGGLRVIANCAVGYDNIDVASATERGIQVSNTPGVLTDATADLAWALLLAVARKVVQADRHVREGAFHGWGPMDFLGADLAGTTLGILGMGRIGQATARRALGFSMRVLYTSASNRAVSLWGKARPEPDFDFGPHPVSLDTLLSEADFLSIHVPLTPATAGIIGRDELERMKSSAILINTSRGRVVDESALVRALRSGRIAGAGLDVYEAEPVLAQGLTELDNVVLLPHIGSASLGTRMKMAMTAANNIIEGLQGKRVPNLVNTDLYE